MRHRKTLLAAASLLFVLSLAGGINAGESRQIAVGDSNTVVASVSNPLQVPDVLRVEFNGAAVSEGLLDVELPEEGSRLDCYPAENACEVALEPGEMMEVDFSITGSNTGRGDFTVLVTSDATGKRSEASVGITVEETREDESFMEFLNRTLGII